MALTAVLKTQSMASLILDSIDLSDSSILQTSLANNV